MSYELWSQAGSGRLEGRKGNERNTRPLGISLPTFGSPSNHSVCAPKDQRKISRDAVTTFNREEAPIRKRPRQINIFTSGGIDVAASHEYLEVETKMK